MKRRIILQDNGLVYLIRYTLFKCPWFAIRLHKILLDDYDCLHDHPWSFLTFIIKGGYYEWTALPRLRRNDIPFTIEGSPWIRKKWHGRFSLLYRPAKWKHRLELLRGKPAWTLVIMFRKQRQWGFWTRRGWVPWFKYESTQNCE